MTLATSFYYGWLACGALGFIFFVIREVTSPDYALFNRNFVFTLFILTLMAIVLTPLGIVSPILLGVTVYYQVH